jgi:acetyl-CoA C-acetyltransferase
MQMNEVVIAAAARTPIGAFQGALAGLQAPELAAALISAVMQRTELAADAVDLALLGNVLSAGLGQAPARQAVLKAGLDQGTQAVTLNRMCGSGLEAVIQASRAIRGGDARLVRAGGMESMSNAPYLLPGARGGLRLGDAKVVDSLVHDGLWDVYSDQHMGSCAELCASRYSFSREEQDAYAVRSYERAQAAVADGTFASEITPLQVPGRRGTLSTVSADEGPGQVDFARLPQLRPAFEQDGTVTAANASTLNDGAAVLLVTSRAEAGQRGLPVLATIKGYAGHAAEPEWFTTAPVSATNSLLARLDWPTDSVDVFEVNEAFSVVPLALIRELDLDPARVNPFGGAVALGHPIGASGARIIVTLLNALQRTGGRRGVATICIGGGEGLALAVETGS